MIIDQHECGIAYGGYMRRITVFVFLFLAVSLVIPVTGKQIVIGVSFSRTDYAVLRDGIEELKRLASADGVKLIVLDGNDDPRLQADQIEYLISEKVSAIILAAYDRQAGSAWVDQASAAGIPVIAYDWLIPNPKTAAYVSVDYYEIGRMQARGILKKCDHGRFILLGGSPSDPAATAFRTGQMEILKPLIDSGKIQVVADLWADNWDPEEAEKVMSRALDEMGESSKPDAVVASNDGTALGALNAMRSRGLAGKTPISGQDASRDGCNSIARGELTFSVHKKTRMIAPIAYNCARALSEGRTPAGAEVRSIESLSLEKAEGSIPCVFIPLVNVDRSNLLKEIVKPGYQEYDVVYAGISDGNKPPRPASTRKK